MTNIVRIICRTIGPDPGRKRNSTIGRPSGIARDSAGDVQRTGPMSNFETIRLERAFEIAVEGLRDELTVGSR